MIIFGHAAITSPKFVRIRSIDELKNAKKSDIVWFEKKDDKDFLLACAANKKGVKYAVCVDCIADFLLYSNLNATYAIAPNFYAKDYQEIAEKYVLDTKILVEISRDCDVEFTLETLAKDGIDGVIFSEFLRLESL